MKKLNVKNFIIILSVLIIALTISVCCFQPKMHKFFQVNIIEYLIKINSDGSVSTTKQTTTTVFKENQ